MDAFISLFTETLIKVWQTFVHNWPFLVASTIIAVWLNHALNPQKVAAFFKRNQAGGVLGAVVAAVATPLCSCGTTAVLLGMMASMMPWAPIVAFMVASPLTSPQELIYSAGLFGWPFALTFFGASIVLGLIGGAAAHFMEKRGWLKDQIRFIPTEHSVPVSNASNQYGHAQSTPMPLRFQSVAETACGCGEPAPMVMHLQPVAEADCGCGSSSPIRFAAAESSSRCCSSPTPIQKTVPESTSCSCSAPAKSTPAPSSCGCGEAKSEKDTSNLKEYALETMQLGGRLLWMFGLFAFIGYFLNGLIPQEWVASIFGVGNVYSVPLAATLGLPLYINSEASLPLVRGLIDGGMSQGAALAFLITGAGTSVGAVAGMLTIARWRVIALVIGVLWSGSIIIGMLYNLFV